MLKNKKAKLLLKYSLFMSGVIVHTGIEASNNVSVYEQKRTSLKEVIDEVEKNTSYSFIYNNEEISPNEIVLVSSPSRTELTDLLTQLEKSLDVKASVKNNFLTLEKRSNFNETKKDILIKGKVVDEKGEPIIGANVLQEGTVNGESTNLDGEFKIKVSTPTATLVISYIGFQDLKYKLTSGKEELLLVLKEDTKALEEVVVVGYGTQKKASVVGSVQTVRPTELKVPSSNLSAGFAGKLAGVIAVQRSGEPGADGADFWIRGISTFNGSQSPLIIIDGVQASSGDLNSLDPEVIESFSVLKDATATALYGSRGANGVMIVTTKTGADQEKAIINIRLENTISNPTSVPEFVDGVRYMEMFNEAVASRRTGEILYSDSKIKGTRLGLNPYIFPNVNWYDELFNSHSMNQNFNFNIRGGSNRINYFSSVSVNHDNGVLKNSKDFSYDNNINIYRYVFQNNIDANITNTTKMGLRLNVQLNDNNGAATNAQDIFGLAMEANPVDFPVRYPNDSEFDYIKWGGKSGGKFNNGYRNPYAEMASGYKSSFSSTVMANLNVDQKLDFIIKGLSVQGLVSFKNWSYTETKRYSDYNQFEVSNYIWDENGVSDDYLLKRIGAENSTVLNTDNKTTGDRRIYMQAMVNYERVFDNIHNVSGMFLYNQDEYNTNNPSSLIASLPQRKQGIAGRLTYSYDYKYMVEANFGYNGSENFAKNKRFGFFPSIALGYVISQENYFSSLTPIINNLKIRGSYGLVGNDQIGGDRYVYLSDIELQNGDLGFTTGRDQNVDKNGPKYIRYPNNKITWEVGRKLNIGLDLGILNQLNLNFDIFKEIRSDIFMDRRSIPAFLGTLAQDKWMDLRTKVYGNLGKVENKGLDFSLDYVHNFNKDLFVSMKSTFTYATNKVLEYDEPDYLKYPNLSRVGHSIDQPLLYIADGLFVDDAEVNNNPKQNLGGFVQAGDIKYLDLPDSNGIRDGVIDANDRRYTGNPTKPEIVYGFGPSIRYKNWDFSFFFQGAAKVSIMMRNIHPFGTDGTRNVQTFIAQNYWTEDNPDINATYPRLSKQDNPNSTVESTYWLRNGAFLKLKNVECGYNFKFLRVYARGSNLLTFSPFDLWDPEQGSGNGLFYPTQRVINVGVQFSFNK